MGFKRRGVPPDEVLTNKVRSLLLEEAKGALSEKRMFGGVCFLVGGNMACGILEEELIVRLGPEGHERAVATAGVTPMEVGGRPLRGILRVAPEAIATRASLTGWVRRGAAYADSLPAK